MSSLLDQLGAMGPPGPPPGPTGLSALAGPEEPAGPQDGGLSALQDVINDFPPLLAALHDPQSVDMAVQAMKLLTAIQKNLMGSSGGAQQGP